LKEARIETIISGLENWREKVKCSSACGS